MKRDVVALFDHLGLDDVLLVGYSMGAHLALRLAPDEPRVKAVVLLGIGERGTGGEDGADRRDALVAVLEAESPDDVDDASLRQFRVMAGLDREPLLAYVTGARRGRPRAARRRRRARAARGGRRRRERRAIPLPSPSASTPRSCGCPATTSPPTRAPSSTARSPSSSAAQ